MPHELTNTIGARLEECPIEPLNEYVIIKPVPKVKTSTIILADQALVSENAGIVIGVGGDVPNGKTLVGKKVVYAKFQHYEPYPFIDKTGKRNYYIILDYRALMGFILD